MNKPSGPLTGIKVVEIGVWHAGPGAAAILGDLGAEIIKVETLEGDPERYHGGFGKLAGKAPVTKHGWNMLYELSNRNKRSIALDATTAEGREILHALVAQADIFVTNLRPAARQKLGIDYSSLRAINAGIVNLVVSAFGPEGPMADWGGFDPLGQAVSGMMFTTGSDEPVLLSWIVLDQMTAIAASHAALAALVGRQATGQGQEVDVSLYSAGIWFQHANLLFSSLSGSLELKWDRTAVSVLRTTFPCRDGSWVVGTNHPPRRGWPQFCAALGLHELADDARFDTEAKRLENRAVLFPILDARFRSRDREEWLRIFSEADMLLAPVNRLEDVLRDEQARANDYIVRFEHRLLGDIAIPGYPALFGATKAGTRSEAPELGEHTAEILAELGYERPEVEALRTRGLIGCAERSAAPSADRPDI